MTDYDKYPGNGAVYGEGVEGISFIGFSAGGMNWLNPYLGGNYDPNEIESKFNRVSETPTVFRCPARKPRPPRPIGPGYANLPDSDYGYNELGTDSKTGMSKLGLGFTMQFAGFDENGYPSGLRSYVNASDVKNPSDLIAIGDGYNNWLSPNYSVSPVDRYEGSSIFPSHNGSANMVFCDGHVEKAKGPKWIEESEWSRKRWNNDNQPHPETGKQV